jgi:AcrR family transcriptional regulator
LSARSPAQRSRFGSKGRSAREATIAKRPDRRPERTRQALVGALVELILERGYEGLTVDDLVERANVGRSSVYAHFGGLEGVLKQALTWPSSRLAELVDLPLTPQDLAPRLDHFKDQRKRNRAFFEPPLRGLWVRRLAELIEPRLEALARDTSRAPPLLPWGFIATQLAENQLALAANWLASRLATPSVVIAEAMIIMTRATIDGLAPGVADSKVMRREDAPGGPTTS